MFEQTASLGGLDIQLCYYRGYGEFTSSPWLSDSQALLQRMMAVYCLGGRTQIEKLLEHALRETARERVNALVFVGDCMEENVLKMLVWLSQPPLPTSTKGTPVSTNRRRESASR